MSHQGISLALIIFQLVDFFGTGLLTARTYYDYLELSDGRGTRAKLWELNRHGGGKFGRNIIGTMGKPQMPRAIHGMLSLCGSFRQYGLYQRFSAQKTR